MNRLKYILNDVTCALNQNTHLRNFQTSNAAQLRSATVLQKPTCVLNDVGLQLHHYCNSVKIRNGSADDSSSEASKLFAISSKSKSAIKRKMSFGSTNECSRSRFVNQDTRALDGNNGHFQKARTSYESSRKILQDSGIQSGIMPEHSNCTCNLKNQFEANKQNTRVKFVRSSSPLDDPLVRISSIKISSLTPHKNLSSSAVISANSGKKLYSKKEADWFKNLEQFLKDLRTTNLGRSLYGVSKLEDAYISQYVNDSVEWVEKMVKRRTDKFMKTANKVSNTLGAVKPYIENAMLVARGDKILKGKSLSPNTKEPDNVINKKAEINRTTPKIELQMTPTTTESVVSVNVDAASGMMDSIYGKELSVVVKSNKRSNAKSALQTKDPLSRNSYSSMRFSVSENSMPIKQIELLINGKPVSEVKTIRARTEKIDVVSSLDQIEVRVPVSRENGFGVKNNIEAAKSNLPILNLQISARLEKPGTSQISEALAVTEKGMNQPETKYIYRNSAINGNNVNKYDDKINSANSKSILPVLKVDPVKFPKSQAKSGPKSNDLKSNDESTGRVISKIVPWWSSDASYKKIAKLASLEKPARIPKAEQKKSQIPNAPKKSQAKQLTTRENTARKLMNEKNSGSNNKAEALRKDKDSEPDQSAKLERLKRNAVTNIGQINVGFDSFSDGTMRQKLIGEKTCMSPGNSSGKKHFEKLLDNPSSKDSIKKRSSPRTKINNILNSIKPIEKKKDGTLIDKGVKVSSRENQETNKGIDKNNKQNNFSSTSSNFDSQKVTESKKEKIQKKKKKKKIDILNKPYKRSPSEVEEEYTLGKPPDPIPNLIPVKKPEVIVPNAPHGPAGVFSLHEFDANDSLLDFDLL